MRSSRCHAHHDSFLSCAAIVIVAFEVATVEIIVTAAKGTGAGAGSARHCAAGASAAVAAVAAVAAAAAAAVFGLRLSYLTNRHICSASAIRARDKEAEGQVQIFTLLRCSIHISHDIS